MNGSALFVNKYAPSSLRAVTMLHGVPTARTVLQFVCISWTVANYSSKHADCIDVRPLYVIFCYGRNAIMYEPLDVKHDTYFGGWNLLWLVAQSHCPGYMDSISLLEMLLERYEDKSSSLPRLATLDEHAGIVKTLIDLKTRCLDRPRYRQ